MTVAEGRQKVLRECEKTLEDIFLTSEFAGRSSDYRAGYAQALRESAVALFELQLGAGVTAALRDAGKPN